MSKKQKEIQQIPDKLVIKQPHFVVISIMYAVLTVLAVILTMAFALDGKTVPVILFIISLVYYIYSSLYVLSRTQYDVETLAVSYRKLLILCVLAVFAAMAPMYAFFGMLENVNFVAIMALSCAILTLAVGITLFVSVLSMRKKAKRLKAERRRKRK